MFAAGLKKLLNIRTESEALAQSLPALLQTAEHVTATLVHGQHARRKSGIGQSFWQFREYAAGDRPQDIDWRQSAKTNSVYIRQKEMETTQKTLFWCAGSSNMHFHSDNTKYSKQEAAAIICLTIALLLTHGEEQIGVLGDSKTGRSERRIEQLGQYLISAREDEHLPATMTANIPLHTNLILASDFLSPIEDISTTFKTLAMRAGRSVVIMILDPAEIDFNFQGRVTFENTSDKETINHASSVRAQYQDRILAHIKSVDSLCKDLGWTFILHRTDEAFEKNISHLWHSGGGRTG